MLTLIISRPCDETTDRGPSGRSDSEGLGVLRVGALVMVEPSVSDCRWTGFFVRAILVFKLSTVCPILEGVSCLPLFIFVFTCLFISLSASLPSLPLCMAKTDLSGN